MSDLRDGIVQRLRAIMTEFDVPTRRAFAEVIGVSESSVSNWISPAGTDMPRVPEMIRLCERTGISLDWIYRGAMSGMDHKLGVKLNKRLDASRNKPAELFSKLKDVGSDTLP